VILDPRQDVSPFAVCLGFRSQVVGTGVVDAPAPTFLRATDNRESCSAMRGPGCVVKKLVYHVQRRTGHGVLQLLSAMSPTPFDSWMRRVYQSLLAYCHCWRVEGYLVDVYSPQKVVRGSVPEVVSARHADQCARLNTSSIGTSMTRCAMPGQTKQPSSRFEIAKRCYVVHICALKG
jgi:hypothetical protein